VVRRELHDLAEHAPRLALVAEPQVQLADGRPRARVGQRRNDVAERVNPTIINASRKRRIAQGSGTSVQEVNRLLKQFEDFRKIWKQMKRGKGFSLFGRKPFGWGL
ncbi:MAG: signal recognition particle protein, partial [Atribacterota bacterium]